jgi:hypothetical protein
MTRSANGTPSLRFLQAQPAVLLAVGALVMSACGSESTLGGNSAVVMYEALYDDIRSIDAFVVLSDDSTVLAHARAYGASEVDRSALDRAIEESVQETLTIHIAFLSYSERGVLYAGKLYAGGKAEFAHHNPARRATALVTNRGDRAQAYETALQFSALPLGVDLQQSGSGKLAFRFAYRESSSANWAVDLDVNAPDWTFKSPTTD